MVCAERAKGRLRPQNELGSSDEGKRDEHMGRVALRVRMRVDGWPTEVLLMIDTVSFRFVGVHLEPNTVIMSITLFVTSSRPESRRRWEISPDRDG